MNCECLGLVNERLNPQGLRVSPGLIIEEKTNSSWIGVYVVTQRIDRKKKKADPVIASFCPFCGKKCKPEDLE